MLHEQTAVPLADPIFNNIRPRKFDSQVNPKRRENPVMDRESDVLVRLATSVWINDLLSMSLYSLRFILTGRFREESPGSKERVLASIEQNLPICQPYLSI